MEHLRIRVLRVRCSNLNNMRLNGKCMRGFIFIVLILICCSIYGQDYSYKSYIPKEEEEPITKEDLAEKCLKSFFVL